MRRACLLLLASCGFKGPTANQVDPDANQNTDAGVTDGAVDAGVDAKVDASVDPMAACWSAKRFGFDAAACASSPRDRIDISGEVFLDTVTGVSTPPGLTCADLDTDMMCALAAKTIRITAGAKLAVHGARPLALLAHSIQ